MLFVLIFASQSTVPADALLVIKQSLHYVEQGDVQKFLQASVLAYKNGRTPYSQKKLVKLIRSDGSSNCNDRQIATVFNASPTDLRRGTALGVCEVIKKAFSPALEIDTNGNSTATAIASLKDIYDRFIQKPQNIKKLQERLSFFNGTIQDINQKYHKYKFKSCVNQALSRQDFVGRDYALSKLSEIFGAEINENADSEDEVEQTTSNSQDSSARAQSESEPDSEGSTSDEPSAKRSRVA